MLEEQQPADQFFS